MNSKELLGIGLLLAGSALIFAVAALDGGLLLNALGGVATLALAGGALAYGTEGEDGRPV